MFCHTRVLVGMPLSLMGAAIPLSINAAWVYNVSAARILIGHGLTRSCHQRDYCASFLLRPAQAPRRCPGGRLTSPASATYTKAHFPFARLSGVAASSRRDGVALSCIWKSGKRVGRK